VILAHIITQAYRCIVSCLAAEFTQWHFDTFGLICPLPLGFQNRRYSPLFLVNFLFILVLSIIANVFEHIQSRSGSCVSVYVEDVSTFDLLEESHSRVSLVILHHFGIALSLFNVVRWMLEDASGTIRALTWVLQEVLAY